MKINPHEVEASFYRLAMDELAVSSKSTLKSIEDDIVQLSRIEEQFRSGAYRVNYENAVDFESKISSQMNKLIVMRDFMLLQIHNDAEMKISLERRTVRRSS